MMHLFKVKRSKFSICVFTFYHQHTLRLYAIDRLTADACIQHDAFIYLNRKRTPHTHHRPYVPVEQIEC